MHRAPPARARPLYVGRERSPLAVPCGAVIMEIILWIVAVYALICAVVHFGNRLHMYFPDPTRTAPAEAGLDGVEEVEIVTNDGVTLVAWHAPTKKDKP